MKRSASIVLTVLVVLLAVSWQGRLAGASRSAEPLAPQAGAPTVVSYQGQILVAGAAYTGTGYFKFAVVDATGTTIYWSNTPKNDAAVSLTVSNGLFNVLLGDTTLAHMMTLPATTFDGTERYLRVWFSSDGGTTFTLLAPDRRIAAVPYALQADEAQNASTLAGFPVSAFQRHYQNVVVVAKSGGDYTSIQAALNGISASDANRYLVWVAPGVYNERVTMKEYVDIEGAGELITRITYSGSAWNNTGAVVGANNVELRTLTVENTGGDEFAIAIYNGSVSPRLTHVTAKASGGVGNYGVYNDTSSPTMKGVTATASGGAVAINHGVYNYGALYGSSPTMTDITATASGGTDSTNYGVRNYGSSPTMTGVTATASGEAGSANTGMHNYSSSVTIQNSTLGGAGGSVSRGLANSAGEGFFFTVKINNCQVTGSSQTIYNDPHFTTRVGASQLDGGATYNPAGGTLTCAGVYDETYNFSAGPACP